MQVCKYFLDAVEKKQYGWFWVCPNGGKDCHYRHALPPGYVLKSQMKALLDEESEKLTVEEEIEDQVFHKNQNLLHFSYFTSQMGNINFPYTFSVSWYLL